MNDGAGRAASFTAALCSIALSALSGCASEYEGVDVFPLYRDVGDEKAGEFFWPLPPYWHSWDESESLSWSFPFHLHRTQGDHSEMTLVPLLPLWYADRTIDFETRAFFPFWQQTSEGVRRTTKYLIFLTGWTTYDDEPGLKAFAIAPLFTWQQGSQGSAFDLVTTNDLITGKTGRGALFSLLAIDRSKPYLGETDGDGIEVDFVNVFGALAQLFHFDDSGTHSETRLLTLFGSEPVALFRRRVPHDGAYGDDEGATMFFPLWFDFHDREGTFFELWPLFGFSSRDGAIVRRDFVWPLLTTHHDDAQKRHGFECIVRLIGSVETNGKRDRWFWPLFSAATSDDGHDWKILFGLLGHRRSDAAAESVLRVFWIPFTSKHEAEPAGDGASPQSAPAKTEEAK